uniref:Uncharacterized protein n=1 Tax=Utricularia reniformis TaxID=192314 RepID=A0A1Y0B471_9LAMI|nr:hypothetical protein AEK19_MT2055 [Utricularia reniformis]ART32212.1 hypothetical protein AEK19_MT2055 [Utricularia reniformis]
MNELFFTLRLPVISVQDLLYLIPVCYICDYMKKGTFQRRKRRYQGPGKTRAHSETINQSKKRVYKERTVAVQNLTNRHLLQAYE